MSNPLKRARTEVDSDPADASIANSTRNSEFWFDDGSVVLNVQSTLFRVHRSILSMHSTVFSDMFSIPQPPDQTAIEGCPVVHLHDSADDFTYLLKALYNPLYAKLIFCQNGILTRLISATLPAQVWTSRSHLTLS